MKSRTSLKLLKIVFINNGVLNVLKSFGKDRSKQFRITVK